MDGLINPFGKIIPPPFILNPSYNEITKVKNQIRWCRETSFWFLMIEDDYFTYWEYENLANLLSHRLQKLTDG